MGDPSLDLRRNLQQPVDRRVITYTTSRDTGSYLRMTSLPGFDETGFHLNAIDLYGGSLPSPEGAAAGRPRFTVDVTVGEFNAEWLPLPYAPASFEASGEWRHDPVSLSVLASGTQQKRATNGLHYTALAMDVTPTAAELAKASAGRPRDAAVTAALPAAFPEQIVQLARQVTAKGTTDGEKAVLLQNWLRGPAFTYSTEPAPGSGYTALTEFLLDDRTGYCEQFAASMAVMARALGIPARVAIGFLPGRKVGDHWEVNIRDMHAWPELYFAGLGWVSFEPTPGVATARPSSSPRRPRRPARHRPAAPRAASRARSRPRPRSSSRANRPSPWTCPGSAGWAPGWESWRWRRCRAWCAAPGDAAGWTWAACRGRRWVQPGTRCATPYGTPVASGRTAHPGRSAARWDEGCPMRRRRRWAGWRCWWSARATPTASATPQACMRTCGWSARRWPLGRGPRDGKDGCHGRCGEGCGVAAEGALVDARFAGRGCRIPPVGRFSTGPAGGW
jgi:transglutaminase-like putative cysteine protease